MNSMLGVTLKPTGGTLFTPVVKKRTSAKVTSNFPSVTSNNMQHCKEGIDASV